MYRCTVDHFDDDDARKQRRQRRRPTLDTLAQNCVAGVCCVRLRVCAVLGALRRRHMGHGMWNKLCIYKYRMLSIYMYIFICSSAMPAKHGSTSHSYVHTTRNRGIYTVYTIYRRMCTCSKHSLQAQHIGHTKMMHAARGRTVYNTHSRAHAAAFTITAQNVAVASLLSHVICVGW